jgi:hypothetical protein
MDHQQGSRPCPRTEEARGKSDVDDGAAWIRALDRIREPECAQAIVDRVEELLWVLDHQDDLDADFLAIYGIDLEQDDAISARRYFALAQRLPAYQGVLAARIDEERERQEPTRTTPTRTSTQAAPARRGSSESTEVSLTQFRAQFPGLVSVSGGNEGGG